MNRKSYSLSPKKGRETKMLCGVIPVIVLLSNRGGRKAGGGGCKGGGNLEVIG